MFEFKNKTISEIRNEMLVFKGKEVTNQGGIKSILSEISDLSEYYANYMNGNFSFTKNGEFDWDKNTRQKKMYGFKATLSNKNYNGTTCSVSEMIAVPYEFRNDKYILLVNSDSSILSKN